MTTPLYQLAKRELTKSIKNAVTIYLDSATTDTDTKTLYEHINKACKQYYESTQEHLKQEFLSRQDGRKAALGNSKIMDNLLLNLLSAAQQIYGIKDWHGFSVIAVGGYGRYELAPYSDVDILFLSRRLTKNRLMVMDFVLYRLWDLGLEVGHAARSFSENLHLAAKDHTVATALLESRFIGCDRSLYNSMHRHFSSDILCESNRHHFGLLKLEERDHRHVRMGDTRYVLEPNIKEGKGALRDLHLLRWLALSLYGLKDPSELHDLGIFTAADCRSYERAVDFFLVLRFHLHYLSGRASEILTFDAQLHLASAMSYRDSVNLRGVERLMRSYFLHATDVAELTRILATDLRENFASDESQSIEDLEGFLLQSGRLNVSDSDIFVASPLEILRIFDLGLRYDLDFHPDVFRAIRRSFGVIHELRSDKRAYDLFLAILSAPSGQERILRSLSECGFLERFLLDFGKVKAQMQYDMYHVYTTDEHTIRAVGNLNSIERKLSVEAHPLACAEIDNIESRKVLYMAVFLHDMAKGRKGDHSELGSKLALRLCPKFGFNKDQCQVISWLVRHHLLMSNTAFKRNLEDSKTISDFVNIVRTPENLRLLLCLTVADITAVGPKVWNNWKAHLIRVLFRQSLSYMNEKTIGEKAKQDSHNNMLYIQNRLYELLQEYPKKQIASFMSIAEPSYYSLYTPEKLSEHAQFVLKCQSQKLDTAVNVKIDEKHSATHLLVYTQDIKGTMAKICAAIALQSCSVVEARVISLKNNMLLNNFTLQTLEGKTIHENRHITALKNAIINSLAGNININTVSQTILNKHYPTAHKTKLFTVPPEIKISNNASEKYTVIEIKGKDKLGLVFSLTNTLAKNNAEIIFAHITTFGEQAHDVFYVQNKHKQKITNKNNLNSIRRALTQTLKEKTKAILN